MLKGRDLTNLAFNRLTVKEWAGKHPHGGNMWFCLCSCGNTKVAQSGNLIHGNTGSCGCLKREVSSRTVKETNARQKGVKRPSVAKPGAAFRMLFRSYRKDAVHRGYSFNLPEDKFREITSSPCCYCGALPSHKKIAQSGEVYFYNGIDRRHNEVGYEPENCVPCCERCNRFKGRLDADDFVVFASTIFRHCILGVAA